MSAFCRRQELYLQSKASSPVAHKERKLGFAITLNSLIHDNKAKKCVLGKVIFSLPACSSYRYIYMDTKLHISIYYNECCELLSLLQQVKKEEEEEGGEGGKGNKHF